MVPLSSKRYSNWSKAFDVWRAGQTVLSATVFQGPVSSTIRPWLEPTMRALATATGTLLTVGPSVGLHGWARPKAVDNKMAVHVPKVRMVAAGYLSLGTKVAPSGPVMKNHDKTKGARSVRGRQPLGLPTIG